MTLTTKQFEKIEGYFPVARGNVKMGNHLFLMAILYIIENGCKWRQLPERFGKWNSVYKKVSRWAKEGVLDRIFLALQKERLIEVRIEVLALDSTSIKVHPDAHGALKKTGSNRLENPEEDGIPSFMWCPRMTNLSLKCICPEGNATTRRKVVRASKR